MSRIKHKPNDKHGKKKSPAPTASKAQADVDISDQMPSPDERFDDELDVIEVQQTVHDVIVEVSRGVDPEQAGSGGPRSINGAVFVEGPKATGPRPLRFFQRRRDQLRASIAERRHALRTRTESAYGRVRAAVDQRMTRFMQLLEPDQLES